MHLHSSHVTPSISFRKERKRKLIEIVRRTDCREQSHSSEASSQGSQGSMLYVEPTCSRHHVENLILKLFFSDIHGPPICSVMLMFISRW